MLATLRQRNFALLWTAGLISFVGDWALLAALPVYVYEQTNSTLASGAVLLMYALSGFLVGSIAGVFVDRWDRRRTMLTVSLLQALLTPCLLLALRDGWLGVVYLVTFLEGSLFAVFTPAESALLPRLVGEDRLVTANALNALNDNLGRVVRPAVGGLVLVRFGLAGAVLVDAASYLVAALLIVCIAIPGDATAEIPDTGERARETISEWVGVWSEWVEGLRLIRTDQLLRVLFVIVAIGALADSLASSLLVPFVVDVAAGGAAAFGLFLFVRGVAGLLGGVIVGRFGHLTAPAALLGWSMVAFGVGFLVMVNARSILMIVVAPATVGWPTTQQTLLQTAPEDRYRGRVFGAVGTTTSLMAIAGFGAGSALGDVVGVVPLLNLSALLYVGAGALALLRLRSVSERRITERESEAGATL